jgi:methanogenic corrinoid protein MtbC1
MGNPLGEAEYPIAAVSKLTGVSCHALRIWERRYGFPLPHRSASGHRRYGVDQVLILRRLTELSRAGRPIGELIAEVRAGTLTADEPAPASVGADRGLEGQVAELMERLLAGDLAGGAACFDRLEAALEPEELATRVIAPALTETGERWFRRRCAVYQERCVSGFLRRRLDTMIEAARRANALPARTVLLGTVQGDRHEGGVLIANLLLERAGWRVINLGVDLPVAEFAKAVEHLRPNALALSFVLSRNINKRFQELSRLRGLPVYVGGRSILNYQGLARRHGLTPVPGPVTGAVEQMLGEFEVWARRQPECPPPTP